ncbi:MAG TPA: hypothetical protein EYN86_02580, partial [Planctomycetes bacterium]|nr:hypothetical protein [Planctomycetota bacterium]
RGKGGGIKVCGTAQEVIAVAGDMIGMNLVTPQTGVEGQEVRCVYIEEACEINRELYLGLLLDRANSRLAFVGAAEGGMNIEEVAAATPEKILRASIDPSTGMLAHHARNLAFGLGLQGSTATEAIKTIHGVYEAFTATESNLIEINPLVVTKDEKIAAEDVQRLMLDIEIPDGYSWKLTGGYERTSADMGDLMSALVLAIGLVFLLMGLLFNSVILPLSALTTIAFAVLGSNWAFKLSGQPFGSMEMVGMIVLAGVVVNNAIVLIDRILQLERRGQQLNEAIINAVNDRMRPVFMTALTTVCGLLPIAISEPSSTGVSFKGMAIGIVGGISVATIFTLTVVPLSFSLFRDFGRLCSNAFASKPLN